MKEYFEQNPESVPYLERLEKEWDMHGKIIIACDFDDTISPWGLPHTNFDMIINLLKEAKKTGAFITIFTACNTDRYPEIREYCNSKGLHIDSINETPIPLPYGSNGKVYANIFIDDRAGLMESLKILEYAMYRHRGKNRNEGYEINPS